MNTAVERIDAAVRRLRRRLVGVAVLTVSLVLAITGVVLVHQQRTRLLDVVDENLASRAAEILADGRNVAVADLEDRAAQITALDGTVLAASPNLAGAPPIAPIPADRESVRTVSDLPIEDDDYRVLSLRDEESGVVVHVADNVDDVGDSTRVLAVSLAVAFPVVVAALGLATWWLVGRTLRPVKEAAVRQERFVADASHELRSPLARIRARLEVDLAHPEGVDPGDTMGAVLAETRSMQSLVSDLLHLSRGDGRAVGGLVVDLDEVVLSEVEAVRSGAAVRLDVSGVSGGAVTGGASQLRRVVRNVLDNAARHAGSTVRVALTEEGDVVRLDVDDDGGGIPPDRRDLVFERFTRLDDARGRPGGGAGLGLAIAREIVEAHGGTIAVSESVLGGARVRIELPAAPAG